MSQTSASLVLNVKEQVQSVQSLASLFSSEWFCIPTIKYHQQEHLAAHKHEHIVHRHEQPMQLGLKHPRHDGFPTGHLGLTLKQLFMQLGLKHSGHFGRLNLILQHLLAQHMEVDFNLFCRQRVWRIFLSRTSVVKFSISWTNLQRWRM